MGLTSVPSQINDLGNIQGCCRKVVLKKHNKNLTQPEKLPQSSPAAQPVPGYGLFATADDGQIALGVLSEQHFWSSLCAELGLDDVADLSFKERSARGAEVQRTVAAAIARRRQR